MNKTLLDLVFTSNYKSYCSYITKMLSKHRLSHLDCADILNQIYVIALNTNRDLSENKEDYNAFIKGIIFNQFRFKRSYTHNLAKLYNSPTRPLEFNEDFYDDPAADLTIVNIDYDYNNQEYINELSDEDRQIWFVYNNLGIQDKHQAAEHFKIKPSAQRPIYSYLNRARELKKQFLKKYYTNETKN